MLLQTSLKSMEPETAMELETSSVAGGDGVSPLESVVSVGDGSGAGQGCWEAAALQISDIQVGKSSLVISHLLEHFRTNVFG